MPVSQKILTSSCVDVDKFADVLKIVSNDFTPKPENPAKFAEQTNVLPLAAKNSGVRVYLIFSFLPFERKAIEHSKSASVENKTINIVQAEELIIYKIMAGRPIDLEDIRSILNHRENKLDIKSIEVQVKELSVALGNDSLIHKWQKIYSDFKD